MFNIQLRRIALLNLFLDKTIILWELSLLKLYAATMGIQFEREEQRFVFVYSCFGRNSEDKEIIIRHRASRSSICSSTGTGLRRHNGYKDGTRSVTFPVGNDRCGGNGHFALFSYKEGSGVGGSYVSVYISDGNRVGRRENNLNSLKGRSGKPRALSAIQYKTHLELLSRYHLTWRIAREAYLTPHGKEST